MITATDTYPQQPSAPKGRFAPSPTGRMHLGNVFTALLSWLSVKSRGGSWILRIEDLDRSRSRAEYVNLIEDDLNWLGLDHDEGGSDDKGPSGPYVQSRRDAFYADAFERLRELGMIYPCRCRRADLLAASAPHASDGRVVYSGRCRPGSMPCVIDSHCLDGAATRLWVPAGVIHLDDMLCGPLDVDVARECGDYIIRRADGSWGYQLAVVVDDALMGVTEVVRGNDLLLSAAQQTMLFRLLGYRAPAFGHVPLIVNDSGRRLSKRDSDLSMEALRRDFTPGRLCGILAHLAGLAPTAAETTPQSLLETFSWQQVTRRPTVTARL